MTAFFLLLLLIVASPLFWLARPHRFAHSGWLAALLPAIVTGWLVSQAGAIVEGTPIVEHFAWSPALGLDFALRIDGLGLLFGLIIAGIGTAIAIYAAYYFEGDERLGYFYTLFFLFMSSMLGVVWADNLLLLFIFWEGTSITSYLLISFKLADNAALEGARRALIVTSLGALAMLAGFVLLGHIGDTSSISALLTLPPAQVIEHPLFAATLLLILLGAFTKSAQFPFHFWLPGAMAAPTPASAYLHSATMVKAGVYLLARLYPLFHESQLWFWTLLLIGGATMLLGAISALRYYDIKAILAYATVSQLGILVMLLAFPSEKAVMAVCVGILAHALYKGPLFLVAGIIDHATGTRDLRRLAGLSRSMPWVTATALLASVSMAGFPPTFGFLAKETLLETFFKYGEEHGALLGWIGMGLGALAGALFVAYSLTLLWEPFFRKQSSIQLAGQEVAHVHHAPSLPFVLPALTLVGIGTLIPFALAFSEHWLLAPAANAIAGKKVEVHLALWHGFNTVFITSLLAITTGIGLFLVRGTLRNLLNNLPEALNGRAIFDRTVAGTFSLADWTVRTVQNTSLATQISVTFISVLIVLGAAFLQMDFSRDWQIDWLALPRLQEVVLALLAISATIVAVRAENRLSAIISMGVVGVVVTLAFAFFGAPDLALTQLLIEILTLVLLVFVFYRIPPSNAIQQSGMVRWRNLLVSGAVGVWGFVMVLWSISQPFAQSIKDFYLLNSVPAAHGGNITNVIIVDFRGFDTMGEISVLVIAAIGGYALLRASRLRPDLRRVTLAHATAPIAKSTDAQAMNTQSDEGNNA